MGMGTHLNKILELRIIGRLIVDPIPRDRIIRNILQICVPEAQNRIAHWSGDTPDDRMLLSLDLEEPVQEQLMMDIQLVDVAKDVPDECFQPFWRDNVRVYRMQRFNEYLQFAGRYFSIKVGRCASDPRVPRFLDP